jgi:hypothetical protein
MSMLVAIPAWRLRRNPRLQLFAMPATELSQNNEGISMKAITSIMKWS